MIGQPTGGGGQPIGKTAHGALQGTLQQIISTHANCCLDPSDRFGRPCHGVGAFRQGCTERQVQLLLVALGRAHAVPQRGGCAALLLGGLGALHAVTHRLCSQWQQQKANASSPAEPCGDDSSARGDSEASG